RQSHLRLEAGEWFRRGLLLIAAPDWRVSACPLSGRNSLTAPSEIVEPPLTLGGDIYHKGLPSEPFTPFTALKNRGYSAFKPFTPVRVAI
ncbi:MAG: hypothetical protein WA579_05505, partial [Rhodomicrobium sp.]